MDNSVQKDTTNKGLSFKGFWNLAKYIIENISYKNEPFMKTINNNAINYLLSCPILTDDAQEYSSYLVINLLFLNEICFKINCVVSITNIFYLIYRLSLLTRIELKGMFCLILRMCPLYFHLIYNLFNKGLWNLE